MRLVDRTHGHWPWVSAASAVPVTVAVAGRPGLDPLERMIWATLPATLWHQTEEWVWPGGFLPWFNRDVIGSGEDEFPIDRTAGLLINTGLGWGLCAAAGVGGMRTPALASTSFGVNLANALIHLGIAARTRAYNPGTLTSALLYAPLGIAGIASIARDPRGGPRPAAAGLAAGLASGVGLFAALRLRLRARSRGSA